ncbi:MAG: type II toxin-antitoxin system VapB family antitoxin [Propionibacteriaceae bacterium]|jgi:antitoxin VapB|nr:type II toxin-antitoxin system VapB family antitoxin [Propionibacteriaceae bacterium]
MTATIPERTRVSIFRNRNNQAVRIPKDMSFPDSVTELDVSRVGDTVILRPPRRSWESLAGAAAALGIADDDPFFAYLEERHEVVGPPRPVFDDMDD